MLDFFKTEIGIIVFLTINIILLVSVIISNARINKINKNSKQFMRKLGNGRDISEDLNNYMDRIIDLEAAISETNNYSKQIDARMNECIQKIGIVRYSAYKDSGSDLSYAVALLDNKNNGVVFNGIYSREMSNTYAKPIENGTCKYTLTKEENEAILKAINKN